MSLDVRIGVDVGGSKSHAVAVTARGQVVAEVRRPSGFGADQVMANLIATIADLTAQVEQANSRVSAIGVGMPGLVDQRSQRVSNAVNLGIDELDLQAVLVAQFKTAVQVDNDVNVAALGTYLLHAPSAASLAYLNVGTGIAAGIILNGSIWRGLTGSAGEIGHTPVYEDGLLCVCGQRGCLETVASGAGLARTWPTDHPTPVIHLLTALTNGNATAEIVWESFIDGVARAMQLLCSTYDPEKIVIGGGLRKVGQPFYEALLNKLAKNAADSAFLKTLDAGSRLVTGGAYDLAAPLGAALMTTSTAATSSGSSAPSHL